MDDSKKNKPKGHPAGIPKTVGHPAHIPKTGGGHPAHIPKTGGGHPAHIPKTGGGHPAHIPKTGVRKKSVKPLVSKSEAISKITFFDGLSKTELSKIEPYFHDYRFKRNQYIFWEGDPANKLYVIKSGRVRLLKTSASGREMVLEVTITSRTIGVRS